jgi:hypothetical protein
MLVRNAALLVIAMATPVSAFVGNTAFARTTNLHMAGIADEVDESIGIDAIRRAINYQPGAASTEFGRKYKHLVGAKIKTVGEAFADFSSELGVTVNPLYKNMVTDIVGTTHLIIVNARFQRDAIWSLGILTALDLLLKNYPEPEVGAKIVSALFKSVGLDEDEIRNEARTISDWAVGKSNADVEIALTGEGDSPVAAIANSIKPNDYWMYSRYFGIGLIKIMESTGVEMDKDEVYPVMESWMQEKLGRSSLTACADSDLYFKIKDKLDMMETMMKEIEIREKKRMAERLEDKAEAALRAADREVKMQAEIEAEAAASREKTEV